MMEAMTEQNVVVHSVAERQDELFHRQELLFERLDSAVSGINTLSKDLVRHPLTCPGARPRPRKKPPAKERTPS